MTNFMEAFDAVASRIPEEKAIDDRIERDGEVAALKFLMMRVLQKPRTDADDMEAIITAAEALRDAGDKSPHSGWRRR